MLDKYLEMIGYEETKETKIQRFKNFCEKYPKKAWDIIKRFKKNPPKGTAVRVALYDENDWFKKIFKKDISSIKMPENVGDYILKLTNGPYQDNFINSFFKESKYI